MRFQDRPLEQSRGAPLAQSCRLLLASIALVSYLVDFPGTARSSDATWLLLGGYFLYAAIPFVFAGKARNFFRHRKSVWCDVAWYVMFIAVTDPLTTVLFLFFLFAILIASFQHGSVEGRHVTLGSVALYSVIGIASGSTQPHFEWSWLFLRVVFLLSLGLLVAYWGGAETLVRRRLALMREMNLISNPRFGVDQTVASIMEKLRVFFDADTCVLVFRDCESGQYRMRQASQGDISRAVREQPLPAGVASTLLSFQPAVLAMFGKPFRPWPSRKPQCWLYDQGDGEWRADGDGRGEQVADLLSAQAYLGAALKWCRYEGRLYLTANGHDYRLDDALFLAQASEQAFRLIEHIDLLDRLASGAAQQERQRIVGDLHDSAIQPYIGLKMGLEALREKASADNPLLPQLDKLAGMTAHSLADLRRYVSHLKAQEADLGHVFVPDLRRLAARFEDFYGIHLDVLADGTIDLNDRLSAEVTQVVSEALSNIRKHTTAMKGCIRVSCTPDMLRLEISNANDGTPPPAFTPASIVTRVTSLGGQVRIVPDNGQQTTVAIAIPV